MDDLEVARENVEKFEEKWLKRKLSWAKKYDEDELREKKKKKISYLYFIYNKSHDAIKIGVSINPKERFESFRRLLFDELEFIGSVPFIKFYIWKIEEEINKMFKSLSIKNEWFIPGVEVLDFVGFWFPSKEK